MAHLLDLDLVFVTGKGGVGKTTTAAALASVAAVRGQRVLVCEMDAKGALATAFEVGALEFEPTEVAPGLHAMSMNTEDSLREYLRLFVKIPLIGRLGLLASTFDFVADAAPGVKEILAVGKLCWEVKERNYDLVVVDAEASGHVVSQIGAPRVIADLVQVGLVRDQTQWMLDILEDPQRTGVVVVTTPEEMPVTESIELLTRLRAETGSHPAAVIANRVLPAIFDRAEQPVARHIGDAVPELVAAVGPGAGAVVEAASIIESRRAIGAEHLGRLRTAVAEMDPSGSTGEVSTPLPIVTVSELFSRAHGHRVVTLVAEALDEELG
ncbi:ArsA-related P-loop ATPase [Ilumatobacter nonamiensis]|uniref:ArsA-related P-loop ATPase n=1 Tax=Ilumatobacter nonamiensis TaxID=467093 RepID=UPI00034BDBE3|nr:ArsA-related P-loop ATPase [Ilumatobacter nonamiensis]